MSVLRDFENAEHALIRFHSIYHTGDVFGSRRAEQVQLIHSLHAGSSGYIMSNLNNLQRIKLLTNKRKRPAKFESPPIPIMFVTYKVTIIVK